MEGADEAALRTALERRRSGFAPVVEEVAEDQHQVPDASGDQIVLDLCGLLEVAGGGHERKRAQSLHAASVAQWR